MLAPYTDLQGNQLTEEDLCPIKYKDITFKARRKDNGEEIVGSSLFTIANEKGEKTYFMLQRGETLLMPIVVNEDGNAIQVLGNLYQIDFSTLRMDIVAESIDKV
jgi:hypothetical protein